MKTLKIFNFVQANFLIKNKCNVLGTGYGRQDFKPYIKFECNDAFNKAMKEWQENKKEK